MLLINVVLLDPYAYPVIPVIDCPLVEWGNSPFSFLKSLSSFALCHFLFIHYAAFIYSHCALHSTDQITWNSMPPLNSALCPSSFTYRKSMRLPVSNSSLIMHVSISIFLYIYVSCSVCPPCHYIMSWLWADFLLTYLLVLWRYFMDVCTFR